ncbi:MAG: peptidylprolyl isomerase [Kiritimatiellae bacterium]|nr:peptidylprolyl isomerase [Kiritimatiellia bacterium]
MRISAMMLALLLSGCTEKGERPKSAALETNLPKAVRSVRQVGDPSEVLVEVNGAKFTRGEANIIVEARMSALKSRIPPERVESIRQRMLDHVTDQFVMRTLLLQEAQKLGITVTDAEIAAALEKIGEHLPAGRTVEEVMQNSPLGEERMRDEVRIGLTIDKLLDKTLASKIEVTPAEIEDFIQKNRDRLRLPERVHARHILVACTAEDGEEVRAQKRTKIEGLRRQLLEGADFAALAKQYSDCPSATRGGDLGTFPRGQMLKPFEDAAFSQETNAIGPVVETKAGFHIIQVLEHLPEGDMPREEIVNLVKRRKRQQVMSAHIEQLKRGAEIKYGKGVQKPAQQ